MFLFWIKFNSSLSVREKNGVGIFFGFNEGYWLGFGVSYLVLVLVVLFFR